MHEGSRRRGVRWRRRRVRLRCTLEPHKHRALGGSAREDVVPVRARELREGRAGSVDGAEVARAEERERSDELELELRKPFPEADGTPCVQRKESACQSTRFAVDVCGTVGV